MPNSGILIDINSPPTSRFQVPFGDAPENTPLIWVNSSNLPGRQEVASTKNDSYKMHTPPQSSTCPTSNNILGSTFHISITPATTTFPLHTEVSSKDTPSSHHNQDAPLSNSQNSPARKSKQVRWKTPILEYQFIPHREDVQQYVSSEPTIGSPTISFQAKSYPYITIGSHTKLPIEWPYDESVAHANIHHIPKAPPEYNSPNHYPVTTSTFGSSIIAQPECSSQKNPVGLSPSPNCNSSQPKAPMWPIKDDPPITTPLPLPKRSALMLKRAASMEIKDVRPNKLQRVESILGFSRAKNSLFGFREKPEPTGQDHSNTPNPAEHQQSKSKVDYGNCVHTTLEQQPVDDDVDAEDFRNMWDGSEPEMPATNQPQSDDNDTVKLTRHHGPKSKSYAPLTDACVLHWKTELDVLKYLSNHHKVTDGSRERMEKLLKTLDKNKDHPQLTPELMRKVQLVQALRPFRHKTEYGVNVRRAVQKLWGYWRENLMKLNDDSD